MPGSRSTAVPNHCSPGAQRSFVTRVRMRPFSASHTSMPAVVSTPVSPSSKSTMSEIVPSVFTLSVSPTIRAIRGGVVSMVNCRGARPRRARPRRIGRAGARPVIAVGKPADPRRVHRPETTWSDRIGAGDDVVRARLRADAERVRVPRHSRPRDAHRIGRPRCRGETGRCARRVIRDERGIREEEGLRHVGIAEGAATGREHVEIAVAIHVTRAERPITETRVAEEKDPLELVRADTGLILVEAERRRTERIHGARRGSDRDRYIR